MVHDSKQSALVGLMSMATQAPPRGAHALGSAVQSAVQIPLPTPPGELAERLSLDRMHVRPAPQSSFALQAPPNVVLPGGPPPLPPDPDAPEAPPWPPVALAVPLVVEPPSPVDELPPPPVAVLPVVDKPPAPVGPLPVVVLEPVIALELVVPPMPGPTTSAGPASPCWVKAMTPVPQLASSRARRQTPEREIILDSCNREASRALRHYPTYDGVRGE
jgi:hypothetical protein